MGAGGANEPASFKVLGTRNPAGFGDILNTNHACGLDQDFTRSISTVLGPFCGCLPAGSIIESTKGEHGAGKSGGEGLIAASRK